MRYPFLGLLVRSPAHGYELKQAFEEMFGDIWPELNFGQVYTTLARLERDGLVQSEEVTQEHRRDKKVYEVTPQGHAALRTWIDQPEAGPWVKDEFFMKLTIARLTGTANVGELIERQRRVYLQALHDLSDFSQVRRPGDDRVGALLVEGAALHLEADLKWLDLCEEALVLNAEPSAVGASR